MILARGLRAAVVTLLAIELLDELVYGSREAAWPLIREDLDLSYAEVGLLLSVPAYAGLALEPVFGLLGDTRLRRAVVAGGGVAFALGLALAAAAWGIATPSCRLRGPVRGFRRIRQPLAGDAHGRRARAA